MRWHGQWPERSEVSRQVCLDMLCRAQSLFDVVESQREFEPQTRPRVFDDEDRKKKMRNKKSRWGFQVNSAWRRACRGVVEDLSRLQTLFAAGARKLVALGGKSRGGRRRRGTKLFLSPPRWKSEGSEKEPKRRVAGATTRYRKRLHEDEREGVGERSKTTSLRCVARGAVLVNGGKQQAPFDATQNLGEELEGVDEGWSNWGQWVSQSPEGPGSKAILAQWTLLRCASLGLGVREQTSEKAPAVPGCTKYTTNPDPERQADTRRLHTTWKYLQI